jgi:hypothetical protein
MNPAIECIKGHKVTSLADLAVKGPYFAVIGKFGDPHIVDQYDILVCSNCQEPLTGNILDKLQSVTAEKCSEKETLEYRNHIQAKRASWCVELIKSTVLFSRLLGGLGGRVSVCAAHVRKSEPRPQTVNTVVPRKCISASYRLRKTTYRDWVEPVYSIPQG